MRNIHNATALGEPSCDLDSRIAAVRVDGDAAWDRRMKERFGRLWSGPSDPEEGGW